ncbi:hypothetical protein [Fictibacillus sp. JL2B1089]
MTELPTAKYYPNLDKYLKKTGKNRAFAAMIIGVDKICWYTVMVQKRKNT